MKEKLYSYFKTKKYPLVVLFGSYATGDYHPLSDIDIGVWMDDSEDKYLLSVELEELLQKRVDIVNLKNLWDRDSQLAYAITQSHIPLCIKDNDLYIAFKTKSYLYYFDRKPLFDMVQEAFLQRIENGNIGEVGKIGREYQNFKRD